MNDLQVKGLRALGMAIVLGRPGYNRNSNGHRFTNNYNSTKSGPGRKHLQGTTNKLMYKIQSA